MIVSGIGSLRTMGIAVALAVVTFYPARLRGAEEPKGSTDIIPFETLDTLAKQIVESDHYLGRTRVAIKSGNFIQIDMKPDEAALLAPGNVNIQSLDVLVRSKALQRDLAVAFPGEDFWESPLARVNGAVAGVLNQTGSTEAGQDGLKIAMAQIESQFAIIQNDALALARKKQIDADSSREPAAGFKVEIRIDPPKARVRYMPLLYYLLYRNVPQSLEDRWIDLPQGTQHLIGKYRYSAEWPSELHGVVEGNFEVREDSVITFTPKSK
jgi:hypothetical protein